MAIVPISDAYTDTAAAGTRYRPFTPCVLSNGRFLMVTSTGTTSTARVYTQTDTGWTRGASVALPVDARRLRACSATADGNVLIQGGIPATKDVTTPGPIGLALQYGDGSTPDTRVGVSTLDLDGVSVRLENLRWIIDPPDAYFGVDYHYTGSLTGKDVRVHLASTLYEPINGWSWSSTNPGMVSVTSAGFDGTGKALVNVTLNAPNLLPGSPWWGYRLFLEDVDIGGSMDFHSTSSSQFAADPASDGTVPLERGGLYRLEIGAATTSTVVSIGATQYTVWLGYGAYGPTDAHLTGSYADILEASPATGSLFFTNNGGGVVAGDHDPSHYTLFAEMLQLSDGTSLTGLQPVGPTPTTVSQAQLVRFNAPITAASVIFHITAGTAGSYTLRCNICLNPDGTGALATSGLITVTGAAGNVTATLGGTRGLAANTNYYVVFTSVSGFDTGRIGATYATQISGDFDATFAAARYSAGIPVDATYAIWLRVNDEGTPTVNTVAGTASAYCVLGINGSTITPGAAVAVPDSFGIDYSEPESMIRIPATNRFWAWRLDATGGWAAIDYIQVVGTTPTVLGSGVVTWGTYLLPPVPRTIIPISTTQAITALGDLSGNISLVHLDVTASVHPAVSVQTITGYTYTEGVTLVPGLGHDADMLVRAGGTLNLARVAIKWNGSAFIIDTLPITQLTSTDLPPNYTPRSSSAHIVIDNTKDVVVDGNHVVARRFSDNGSDDNWILFTQYDQSTGDIVAKTWAKGDRNGDTSDALTIDDMAICWDSSTSRILLAATEQYLASGSTWAQAPRLGLYRMSYTLDSVARSQREGFER